MGKVNGIKQLLSYYYLSLFTNCLYKYPHTFDLQLYTHLNSKGMDYPMPIFCYFLTKKKKKKKVSEGDGVR